MQSRSPIRMIRAAASILLSLAINPFTANWLLGGTKMADYYGLDAIWLAPGWACLLLISYAINQFGNQIPGLAMRICWAVSATGLLLATNILEPGYWQLFRLLWLLFVLLLWLRAGWQILQSRRTPKWVQKITMAALGILFLGGIGEGIGQFIGQTHRYNGTLASQVWEARHWQTNTQGFRDHEWPATPDSSKKRIAFLGDSYTAGHGIADPKNRFSDLFASHHPDWEVLNLGIPGADLRTLIQTLTEQRSKLDVVVYAFFPNDIEMACTQSGSEIPHAVPYSDLPAGLRYLIRHSYLLDYLYWRFPHTSELGDFNTWLHNCYKNPAVWTSHLANWQELIILTQSRKIDLKILLIPYMQDLHASDFALKSLKIFLESQQIPVIDGREVLNDLSPEDRVVNTHDAHASEIVHQRFEEAISQLIP